MKKLFILILSAILVCNCFAEDNNNDYDTLVETTAKVYTFGSKVVSLVSNKAKSVNDEYEITDNIKKFIKDKDFDKRAEHFGKSVDEFTNDVKKQVKKESKK